MSFASFLAERGLLVDAPISDNRVHRCRTDTHPKKRNGAYQWDGVSGWAQDWALDAVPVLYRDPKDDPISRAERELLARTRREEERRLRASAAKRARDMAARAEVTTHPYLAAKGFPAARAMVLDGKLLIPAWDCKAYGQRLLSLQTIDAQGHKLFLPGGRMRGAVHLIGPTTAETWLCEGYATALSILAALKHLYRPARVAICFSAGNLIEVAKHLRGRVIADNDASGAGERSAIATGLPYVLPPVTGMDFNDYHQGYGLFAAAGVLRMALRQELAMA